MTRLLRGLIDEPAFKSRVGKHGRNLVDADIEFAVNRCG